jgi:hypothetical protein
MEQTPSLFLLKSFDRKIKNRKLRGNGFKSASRKGLEERKGDWQPQRHEDIEKRFWN